MTERKKSTRVGGTSAKKAAARKTAKKTVARANPTVRVGPSEEVKTAARKKAAKRAPGRNEASVGPDAGDLPAGPRKFAFDIVFADGRHVILFDVKNWHQPKPPRDSATTAYEWTTALQKVLAKRLEFEREANPHAELRPSFAHLRFNEPGRLDPEAADTVDQVAVFEDAAVEDRVKAADSLQAAANELLEPYGVTWADTLRMRKADLPEIPVRDLRNAGQVLSDLTEANSVGCITSNGKLAGWIVPATDGDRRVFELEKQGRLRRGRRASGPLEMPDLELDESLGDAVNEARAEERA